MQRVLQSGVVNERSRTRRKADRLWFHLWLFIACHFFFFFYILFHGGRDGGRLWALEGYHSAGRRRRGSRDWMHRWLEESGQEGAAAAEGEEPLCPHFDCSAFKLPPGEMWKNFSLMLRYPAARLWNIPDIFFQQKCLFFTSVDDFIRGNISEKYQYIFFYFF